LVAPDFLTSQKFSSIEDAKTSESLSSILTTERATDKVVEIFGLSSLNDVYNYNPITQNNVEVQALNSQLENLYTSIPFFIDNMPSSDDVLDVIVNKILSSAKETLTLDLGNQEDLELVFAVDNSPTEEGGDPPNILKQLASTNKQISDATTIEDQVAGKLAARDELIANRIIKELSTLSPDFESTDQAEKFLGSNDDDIIFASGGDDLFGGDATTSLLNEGDIFVGGLGRDTVVLAGSEDDYILMSKGPESDIHKTVNMTLEQGSLDTGFVLAIQKFSNPSGFIYLQSEIIRFTEDITWLEFDEVTGGISGSISTDTLKGSSFTTDIFDGGLGDDILSGFGGLDNDFDIIKGGYGNDQIIVEGKNTDADGGSGHDIFKILGLNGTLMIRNFSSAEDKIDLRSFEKSEGVELTFENISDAASVYSQSDISGVKIDLSTWVKETKNYSGEIIIKDASLSDGVITLADGNILIAENFFIETLTEDSGV